MAKGKKDNKKDEGKKSTPPAPIKRVENQVKKATSDAAQGNIKEAKKHLAKAQKASKEIKKEKNKKIAKGLIKKGKRKIGAAEERLLEEDAPAATPPDTGFVPSQNFPQATLLPPPSLVLYDEEATPIEQLTDLLFEDIGGMELINIARHDTIDGQPVSYTVLKKLSEFNRAFDPNNIIAGQAADAEFLKKYAIDISSRLPTDLVDIPLPNTANRQFSVVGLDDNGDLIIRLLGLNNDEYLQVEIVSDGTIYIMDFTEVGVGI